MCKRWTMGAMAFALSGLLLLGGCSGGMDSTSDYAAEAESAAMEAAQEAAPQEYGNAAGSTESVSTDTGYGSGSADISQIDWSEFKIIRTARLTLETKTFTETVRSINKKVAELGGYIESSRTEGREPQEWTDGGRYGTITARIPGDQLETFLEQAKGMAQVVDESMETDNVTSQYMDTEARKQSLEIQLASIEEIMSKATKLEDVLTLESEISRLRYEIESLGSQLRSWDNLSSMSTVNIEIFEITETKSVVETQPVTLGVRVSEAFQTSLNVTVEFLQGLLIVLVAISPLLVVAAVVLAVVFTIRRRKKRRMQSARKPDAPAEKGTGSGDTEKVRDGNEEGKSK